MNQEKKYWKSEIELKPNSAFDQLRNNEFTEKLPVDENIFTNDSINNAQTDRRDFLKYLGFSTTAAVLASCEGPVHKSVPYVVQPDRIIPGIANYYATTLYNGYDSANVLVKTREGRPIKIENNNLANFSGGANARVNASVLDLYDSLRVKNPKKDGKDISWKTFDSEVNQTLTNLKNEGKQIVLLTQTFASPSTSKLIGEFKEKYGNVKHVAYDAVSHSKALDAFEAKYGERALANYDFSKANTIVSNGAE
jgi:molybdopterin-containing oxidoreductase family iron-sulfur binding subunit